MYVIIMPMEIDQRYGLEALPEHLVVSTDKFPAAIKGQLLKELDKPNKPWRAMDIDALQQDEGVCLRLTLDLGNRPLHLFVPEAGDVVRFDAPILLNFPERASHLDLTELCGENPYLKFRVDEQPVEKGEQGAQEGMVQSNKVLYGREQFEFDTFLESAFVILPFFVTSLDDAEAELRTFLDESSHQVKPVSRPSV
jgi:hypothetical protein